MKVRHIYSIFHLFALLIDGLKPDTLFFSNQNLTILAYRNAYSDIFMFFHRCRTVVLWSEKFRGRFDAPLPYHRFFLFTWRYSSVALFYVFQLAIEL